MGPAPVGMTTTLVPVDGPAIPTFTAPGFEDKARTIAERAARAGEWLAAIFGPSPTAVSVYVPDEASWAQVAPVPIYGMPQIDAGKVVLSATSVAFWRSYTNLLDRGLDDDGRQRLREAYGNPPELGERFADLVVAHELTHHFDGGYRSGAGSARFPRLWLAELFANIGFYGYVAEVEPDQLPTLVTICELSTAAGSDLRTPKNLDRMGEGGAENYVWFQSLLILVARRLWTVHGAKALLRCRDELGDSRLTPKAVLERLARLDADAADAIRRWPDVDACLTR